MKAGEAWERVQARAQAEIAALRVPIRYVRRQIEAAVEDGEADVLIAAWGLNLNHKIPGLWREAVRQIREHLSPDGYAVAGDDGHCVHISWRNH